MKIFQGFEFFFKVIRIKHISNKLPLGLPGELILSNDLEVISINTAVLERFCGIFLQDCHR